MANNTIGYAVWMDKFDCTTGALEGVPGHWCEDSGFWRPDMEACQEVAKQCNEGVPEGGFECLPPPSPDEVCNGRDDNCNGLIDETGCPDSPPACGTADPLCVGDPVYLQGGTTFHSVEDAKLSTAAGEVALVRHYFSSDENWRVTDPEGRSLSLGPKPFGASSLEPSPGLRWWHSFYSFVVQGIPGAEGETIRVATPEGRWLTFMRCQGASCWAGHPEGSTQRERLHVQAGAAPVYSLHREDGGRLEYSGRFVGATGELSFFLKRVFNSEGEVLAQLDYALPVIDGQPCPGCEDCQGQGCQTSCTEGVPYLSRIRAASGAELRFHYLRAPSSQECVIASVGASSSADGEEATVVTYDYPESTDGPLAGFLAAARWPSASGEEVESYVGEGSTFRIINAKGEVVHRYGEGQGATSTTWRLNTTPTARGP